MKKILKLFKSNKNIYQKLNFLKQDKVSNLNKNNFDENKEFNIGLVAIILILLFIISISYYLLIFQPQMNELNEHKNLKVNQVNQLFNSSTSSDANKQAILAQIDSSNTIEEVDAINVQQWAYPIIKNSLLDKIHSQKDKFNRVQIVTDNSSDIVSVNQANKIINSSDVDKLASMDIITPDTVIIPLNLNRKQAASGLLKQKDNVDIYCINTSYYEEDLETTPSDLDLDSNNSSVDDDSQVIETSSNTSNKVVGGATVVSILRSKDSGLVNSNIELSQYPHTRNYTQTSNVDVEEVIKSKSSGTLDESQLKILLDDYGWKISNYERIANIGDLDCEYIIMVEVPRDNAQYLIDNMDNLLLAIPTYDAPSWVEL